MADRPTPADLEARVADLEARVSALETVRSDSNSDGEADPVELDQLRWFVKHGRRRPW